MSNPLDVRNKRILHSIDLANSVGLEIGPLSAPVVKKEQSKVFYLDHTSTENLIKKYKDDPINHEDIVHVDYILKGGLKETVKNKKFDYIVAAHVIEHIPNVAEWLQEVASILKPGGVLSLVIPDKRYTFDIKRQVTRPSEVMGIYLDGLKKASSTTVYDFFSNYVDGVDTARAWEEPSFYKKAKSRWDAKEAYKISMDSRDSKKYVDCHCSVFTPRSFVEVLRELIDQETFDYKVDYFIKTQPYELEFYVTLVKTARDKKSQVRTLPKFPQKSKKSVGSERQEEVDQLKQELDLITQSVSWRVTSPIRKIKKAEIRIKNSLKPRT
jgi:SAM-dependent methyltransferase